MVIISDVHYGNPLFSLHHLERTIKFVREKEDVFAFLNGDLLEAVTKNSKGNIYRQVLSPKEQRDDIIDLLKPIKDKILGMTEGNHEMRLHDSDADFSEDISKALGVPYRPEGMAIKILFGSGSHRMNSQPFTFKGYCTHGYGGARTKGGKSVKLERTAAFVTGDFYAMSHDHDVNVASLVNLSMDERGYPSHQYPGFISGVMTHHTAKLIKTNAYLKWGEYSEMGGFPPVNLDTPVIWLLTPQSERWDELPDKPGKEVKVLV